MWSNRLALFLTLESQESPKPAKKLQHSLEAGRSFKVSIETSSSAVADTSMWKREKKITVRCYSYTCFPLQGLASCPLHPHWCTVQTQHLKGPHLFFHASNGLQKAAVFAGQNGWRREVQRYRNAVNEDSKKTRTTRRKANTYSVNRSARLPYLWAIQASRRSN